MYIQQSLHYASVFRCSLCASVHRPNDMRCGTVPARTAAAHLIDRSCREVKEIRGSHMPLACTAVEAVEGRKGRLAARAVHRKQDGRG